MSIRYIGGLCNRAKLAPSLVAGAALFMAACGADAPPAAERTPEEIVAERAQERWNALIAGEVELVYGFTSPAYRSAVPLERYRARFGGAVQWTGAELDSVSCEPEVCTATVMLSYRMVQHRMENTRAMEERWVHADGEWWLHAK